MKKLISIILISTVLFSCKKEQNIPRQIPISIWSINGINQQGISMYINNDSENIFISVSEISSVGIHFKLNSQLISGKYSLTSDINNIKSNECYLFSAQAGNSTGKYGDSVTVSFIDKYAIISFDNISLSAGIISGILKQ